MIDVALAVTVVGTVLIALVIHITVAVQAMKLILKGTGP